MDAFGAEQRQLGTPENFQPGSVESFGAARQLLGLLAQPGSEHLVGAHVEPGTGVVGSGCDKVSHETLTSPVQGW